MDRRSRRIASVLTALLMLASSSLASCSKQPEVIQCSFGTPEQTTLTVSPANTPEPAPTLRTPAPIPSQTPFPFAEVAYKGAKLTLNPPEGKLCVGILPTCYNPWPRYYYVPTDEEQKRLRELMEKNDWKGERTILMINDTYISRGSELFDYAYSLVHKNCGISMMDPKDIHDIVKAQMYYTRGKIKSTQTITDPKKLALIEQRLSAAVVTEGGKCPYSEGLLVLTCKDGETIMVRLSSDNCSDYFHDGQYFKYEGPNTDILFMFDKIQWAAFSVE